jgi:hypothetical protein
MERRRMNDSHHNTKPGDGALDGARVCAHSPSSLERLDRKEFGSVINNAVLTWIVELIRKEQGPYTKVPLTKVMERMHQASSWITKPRAARKLTIKKIEKDNPGKTVVGATYAADGSVTGATFARSGEAAAGTSLTPLEQWKEQRRARQA